MPDATGGPFICNLNRHVAKGPVIAEAAVGAIQMRGLRTILGIWSMDVPKPCATRPPQPFSRKLITAKPTIWAQQPATAAPPARPTKPKEAQMAAEEMGSVSAMPMVTETSTPIKKGWRSVAHMMKLPTAIAAAPISGAISLVRDTPIKTVTAGVTRMSTFVSLDTALPNSAAMMAINSTASGPPAPPSLLAAQPTAARE